MFELAKYKSRKSWWGLLSPAEPTFSSMLLAGSLLIYWLLLTTHVNMLRRRTLLPWLIKSPSTWLILSLLMSLGLLLQILWLLLTLSSWWLSLLSKLSMMLWLSQLSWLSYLLFLSPNILRKPSLILILTSMQWLPTWWCLWNYPLLISWLSLSYKPLLLPTLRHTLALLALVLYILLIILAFLSSITHILIEPGIHSALLAS